MVLNSSCVVSDYNILCRLLRFPPKEAIAVLIMSSQKTMPFAVSIIALLPASLGSKGLLTLPPLIAQVGSRAFTAMGGRFAQCYSVKYFIPYISAHKH